MMKSMLLATTLGTVKATNDSPGFKLTFVNNAPHGVTLENPKGCDHSFGRYDQGESADLFLPVGVTKLWVKPDACAEEDGCFTCVPDAKTGIGPDCLGCFYISANVMNSGNVVVTGIGYGENNPVKLHHSISQATLTATDVAGKHQEIVCNEKDCGKDVYNHIIQAAPDKSNPPTWTISGPSVVV